MMVNVLNILELEPFKQYKLKWSVSEINNLR